MPAGPGAGGPAEAPRAGEVIDGRFRILEPLGAGASASVHRALDLEEPEGSPDRHVALKVLHPSYAADAGARESFLREAERIGALESPNVARLLGSGIAPIARAAADADAAVGTRDEPGDQDAEGATSRAAADAAAADAAAPGESPVTAWIALELCEGPTLRALIADGGPLPPHVAAGLVDGVLSGLAAAHAAGLIHRDLSPQNVMLRAPIPPEVLAAPTPADGSPHPAAALVRILDFGLADLTGRATVGADVLRLGAGHGRLVIGSCDFMSPEQAQALPVRSVSDVYQAGCLLVFALTGHPPFPGSDPSSAAYAHVHSPPPMPGDEVPAAAALDRTVARALAKTPVRRFRSALEFQDALREAAAQLPPPDAVSLPAEDSGEFVHAGLEVPTAAIAASRAQEIADRASAAGTGAGVSSGSSAAAGSAAGEGAGGARSVLTGALAALGAACVVALVVVLAVMPKGGQPAATASAPASEAPAVAEPLPSAASSGTASPEASASEVALVAVPTLAGTAAEAQAVLESLGLALGTTVAADGPSAAGAITGQEPAAGTMLAPGSAVTVEIASGQNTVPAVAGMTAADAASALAAAGFRTVTPSSAAAIIARAEPAAGTRLAVGEIVILVVEPGVRATSTASPTPTVVPSASPTSSVGGDAGAAQAGAGSATAP